MKREGGTPPSCAPAASMAALAAASAPARSKASRPLAVRGRTLTPPSPHTCRAHNPSLSAGAQRQGPETEPLALRLLRLMHVLLSRVDNKETVMAHAWPRDRSVCMQGWRQSRPHLAQAEEGGDGVVLPRQLAILQLAQDLPCAALCLPARQRMHHV